jgi:hypothetical protein
MANPTKLWIVYLDDELLDYVRMPESWDERKVYIELVEERGYDPYIVVQED